MSALRYYDFPATEPKSRARRMGLMDRVCARLWTWAAEDHRRTLQDRTDPADDRLRRDIGLDGDTDRNWL